MGFLHDAGLAQVYDQDIFALNALLEAMSARGMPVDRAARAEALHVLEDRADAILMQIRALVPEECRPLKVYKKKPSVRLPFRPSPQQLVKYLRYKGLRVPKKDGRDTIEETALRRLALSNPQDPVLPLVLAYRSNDMDRRFVVALHPDETDGVIRTTFTHDPSTLRLSSKNPSLQNIPR